MLFFSVTRHLCTSSNVKSIIHNPNYPLFPELEIHPFINPLVSKIPSYCPPYFFVAEQDDKCILDSLRVFSQIRKALLLNFRCSIIRALSLGYILGYEHITLVGLDPSSPYHWYTIESVNNQDYWLPEIDSYIFHLIDIKRQILLSPINGRTMHEGDLPSKGYFTFTNSIFSAIRSLDIYAQKNHLLIPTISVVSSDQSILQSINQCHLTKRINFSLV